MPYPIKQKVVAYITRERDGQTEVLVFDHKDFPDAGTQVPAGTVDPGETPEQTVLREAFEEAGVTDLQINRFLGVFPFVAEARQELHQRHVYHLTTPEPLPDRWEHTVSSGTEDKGLRFAYYWLPIAQAARVLSGSQGDYLDLL
ncbi:MAG TPA: NUDIX domain-containing protein [Symbiobacteriaceae bacterium]|nr:NUDIX domain-containing protein [Symbiobacteriaceae bacterium]